MEGCLWSNHNDTHQCCHNADAQVCEEREGRRGYEGGTTSHSPKIITAKVLSASCRYHMGRGWG